MNRHDPVPPRQLVQFVEAFASVLLITVVGTTGAATVPSVPVPLIAEVLGRRT